MKKILHLFRNSQFTEGFVKFLNKYSKDYKHDFLVYGTSFDLSHYDYLYEKNVRYVISIRYELGKPRIVEYFNLFDKIIFHGLFENEILVFFAQNKLLLNKLYLYFWGGDIPLIGTEDEKKIKKQVICGAAGIVTIVESDYKKVLDLYHTKGTHFCLQYYDEKKIELMKKYLDPFLKKSSKTINIQVGNSATDTNNHIEVLKKLEKYKNEDISIFLPLAYGDKEYAKKVMAFGNDVFENKITFITEMMELEQYTKFIRNIDIAFFAMERQQALGNIYMLLANGCKLFLKRSGQLYEYFTDIVKSKVYCIEDVDNMGFEELVTMPTDIGVNNSQSIYKICEADLLIHEWNKLFQYEGNENGIFK